MNPGWGLVGFFGGLVKYVMLGFFCLRFFAVILWVGLCRFRCSGSACPVWVTKRAPVWGWDAGTALTWVGTFQLWTRLLWEPMFRWGPGGGWGRNCVFWDWKVEVSHLVKWSEHGHWEHLNCASSFRACIEIFESRYAMLWWVFPLRALKCCINFNTSYQWTKEIDVTTMGVLKSLKLRCFSGKWVLFVS